MTNRVEVLRARYEADDESLTVDEIDELRQNLSFGVWSLMRAERQERIDRPKRAAFLKDASPMDVLLWLMRSPTIDTRIQADAAIALLPYLHPKIAPAQQ